GAAASTGARASRPDDAAGAAALPVGTAAPSGAGLMPEYVEPAPSWRTRLHWLALAFVPSSLMLGATTYLSTDIAPIPLIWVIPLALYLLSFILVFARLPGWVHQVVILVLPVVILLQLYLKYSGTKFPLQTEIGLHLAM